MNPQFLARPEMTMPPTAEIILTIIYAIIALVCIVWAIKLSIKGHVTYPIWMILGAIVAIHYETLDAVLGHFIYPMTGQQFTVLELYGIKLPLFLLLTYIFYVGPLMIYLFTKLESGTLTTSFWWKLYAVCVVLATLHEPFCIHFGLWYYWGDNQPMKLFGLLPMWWIFVNPAAIMCMALFCHHIWRDVLERRHTYVLTLLVPLSLYAMHGSMSAPVFSTLGTFTSKSATIVGSFISIAIGFFGMWIGHKIVQKEMITVQNKS